MRDCKTATPRRKRVSKMAEGGANPPKPDAVAQIDAFIAQVGSHDELARRARSVLALQAPSAEDELLLVEHWRRERASWGEKVKQVQEEDEE